ncbi:MAG: hypothetical protein ACYC4Q_09160 [Victivallaceae bacterium]
MYIREKKTKTTPVLQLVSGERGHDGKVRQHIILSLGNVPIPDELRRTIAHEVENRLNGYQRLMPLDLAIAEWVDFILKKLKDENQNHQLNWWYAPALEGHITGSPIRGSEGSPTASISRAAAKAACFLMP